LPARSAAADGPGARAPNPGLGWWLLLAVVWFATLQVRPMFDPDEGRYAEIPREMLVSGDWITPRFNDLKYFEKPPLQYWATAAVYGVSGVHAWSSRLWTVGLAFACLPLIFYWVTQLYGSASALSALTALAVSPFYIVVAHLNLLDPAFTFFLSAMVLAFTRAQLASRGSRKERAWMLLTWALAALAVLSKGIVVAVLAGGALFLYSLSTRDVTPWRRLHLLPGVGIFALLSLPWFLLVSARNAHFAQFFFVHEHFARFLTSVHQRVEPWWFFLPLLLLAVLPWLPPLLHGVRAAWQEGADAVPAPAPFRARRFLLIYAGFTLLFFSASGSKLAPYILPMVPILAALAGAASPEPRQLARHASAVGALLVPLCAAGLLVYSARRNAYLPQPAIAWALAASAVSIAAWLVARRSAVLPAVTASVLGALFAWQGLLCEYGVVPPARSAQQLAAAVQPYLSASTPLYSVGQYRETLSPYLRRTLQLAGYEGELQFGLTEEPQRRLSTEQFAARWSAGGEAVAFFDPGVWDEWRRRGLPGRVIAADNYTVAVSRL
jgi:4-amino-4-deoxy-L-arabinose transferase-like glycosyltransferase